MNEIKDFFDKAAPNWHNTDDPIIIKKILKAIQLKKGDKVLDVGCGKGIITPFIYEITDTLVKAIDISKNMIAGAKGLHPEANKYLFECADFYEYCDAQKYDFIIIYNAYPHFLDKLALKDKAFSLLKENGKLVIAHGMSRSALRKHHSGLNLHISREITSPIEESNDFLDHFELQKWVDDDTFYLMVLKKK
ncbi:MAG: class I SAM-dependent methyltransferase [Bacilli bacterium]|nr:class I SAM-dependent methyltransferase [Bacilli bacterium]